MNRRLPPFASIRAFEAVARKGTLQDASDELLISPSAVSHQVKALEIFVGMKLFLREPHGLSLTKEGQAYRGDLSAALDRIDTGTRRLMAARDEGGLTIQIYPSLAQLWLIPRLADFRSSNPDISVRIVSPDGERSLSGSDIDIAIVCSDTPPNEFNVDELFAEDIAPICAPDYLKSSGPIETASDLLSHCLIGCASKREEWQDWLRGAKVRTQETKPQLEFESRSQALQAAAEGLGVAMARRPFADGMIEAGQLVFPLQHKQATASSYYLIAPERSDTRPAAKRFRAWLLSQVSAPRDNR